MAMLKKKHGHAATLQMQLDSRRREEERDNTIKALHNEEVVKASIESEDRIEDKRFIRRMQHEMKEREMEEAILKSKRDKLLKQQQLEQEERMAMELERIKLEKQRDVKMRQQIRETSIELRELEGKLKSAYMNKERAAQLAEKEALKYDVTARDAEIARAMKEEHLRALEAAKARDMEKYKEQVRYQQELERQLEEQEEKKQQAYEEFLKEKLMIDEIVRKIYEEDQREREMNMEKMHMQQKYITEFKAAREEWKHKEREKMEEENRNIMKFANLQKERDEQRAEERMAREHAMEAVQARLAGQIDRAQQERDEMERVRLELYLEEQEEAERQKEKADIEKRLRGRIELQRTHAEQMHFKALRQQAEEQEEDEFRKQMLAKFAEDDRIEQMNAQKRRMKQLEHKRAVEDLLADRRAQFARDREQEIAERADEANLEKYRMQIIEEERQRLLQEHARKLLGYLPKGVIRDFNDLDMLGSEFKKEYTARQIDPFDEDAWEGRH